MNENLIEVFNQARANKELAVIEGFHALKHALRFNADVTHVYVADKSSVLKLADTYAPDIKLELEKQLQEISEDIFKELPKHSFHTGVIVIAKKPTQTVKKTGRLVYLENPRDPWNVGAIIRVAAAAGAAGVVTTGSMNPWDATAIVSSVGLHFALPVMHTNKTPEDFDLPIVAFDDKGKESDKALPKDAVFVFGEERKGLSEKIKQEVNHLVRIPMQEGVSSLNLATSVAVALYAF